MQSKLKGHVICPNCGKETDFILRRGEAQVWCRKCRSYFRICLEALENAATPGKGLATETRRHREETNLG